MVACKTVGENKRKPRDKKRRAKPLVIAAYKLPEKTTQTPSTCPDHPASQQEATQT